MCATLRDGGLIVGLKMVVDRHQIRTETGKQLACAGDGIGLPAVAIAFRPHDDLNLRASLRRSRRTARANLPDALFGESDLDDERDLPITAATVFLRTIAENVQKDPAVFDRLDFGLVIGNEPAEFLDRHFQRHGRDHVLLEHRVDHIRLPELPPRAIRLLLVTAGAELHDHVAARLLG